MADSNQIAQDLFSKIENYKVEKISHCLTRLRITFLNEQPDANDIKTIKGVIGVIQNGEEFQIILGVGIVDQVYAQIKNMFDNKQVTPTTIVEPTNNSQNFDDIKKKYRKNYFSQALSKFSKIFAPLIPCFIAAGIITAIATIIQISVPHFNDTGYENSKQ
jgi:phosphotransferase system IIB component